MNFHTDDSCSPRSYQEEIQRRTTSRSSSINEESEVEDEEEDGIEIALARSLADNEEEMQVAQALQEEEDLKKAISESEASFQREREVRDLIRASEQMNMEVMIRQEEADMSVTPSVEVQEQMLEWLQEVPELGAMGNIRLSIDDNEDVELPLLYKNYRLVPTLFSENEMWPSSAIRQQLRELQVHRGVEEVREWRDTQSEDDRCLVCLTNVATRLAVPCGHRLSCRPCLSSLVQQDNYYSVTAADGQVVQTDRHLPILCCTCRSIVGQIVTIH